MTTAINIVLFVSVAAVILPLVDLATDPAEFFGRWCPWRKQ